MNQKGFANIILIAVIIILIGVVVGYFVFVKKSRAPASTSMPITTTTSTPTVTPTPTSTHNQNTTEKAIGIIKAVYSKSGKNYIDIDYVELNPNWVPGGMNGPAYQNNNPKIRTFEISPNAKFIVGNPATVPISFSEFQRFFAASNTSVYQKHNPWDIIITNGIVVEIKEHFIP